MGPQGSIGATGRPSTMHAGDLKVTGLATFDNGVDVTAGQIKHPDGTEGAPAIAPRSAPTSGRYYAAGIRESVLGAQKFAIDQFNIVTLADVTALGGVLQLTTDAGVSFGADQTDYAFPNGVSGIAVDVTAAGVDLNSIAGGADGKIIAIIVRQTSANPLNVMNEAAGGTAAMRIRTRSGANTSLAAGAMMLLLYSTVDSRWHEV